MSLLRILLLFLTCECLPAKLDQGNRPLFETQHAADQLFEEKNPLAELKRILEPLERIPAPSHETNDFATYGPVAWYEPAWDEAFDEEGKCADKFSKCRVFLGNHQCYEEKFKKWMQSRCRKTCGFCKEKCWQSKYGCCPDHKTLADGPFKAGCGIKLCVDLRDCEKIDKNECHNPFTSPERKRFLRNNCAYTCRFCKAPNPTADCETTQPIYGCCWNGQEATGWNQQGCLPCEDTYPRLCRILDGCDSPFYNTRKFTNLHCPKTCGRCGDCLDKQDTVKCEKWEREGLCTSPPGWKNYMEKFCAKTCRYCESNENTRITSVYGM